MPLRTGRADGALDCRTCCSTGMQVHISGAACSQHILLPAEHAVQTMLYAACAPASQVCVTSCQFWHRYISHILLAARAWLVQTML